MDVITINDATIAAGKAAFEQYKSAVMCGSDTAAYDEGMNREQGKPVVVGAIVASIENGMNREEQILAAVARVSHCRRTTVLTILIALTGSELGKHLWRLSDGRYSLLQRAANDADTPVALIAA